MEPEHTMETPANALPSTMRSWIVGKNGPPADALQLVPDVPIPTPQGANALIKVAYVSLNPADLQFMKKIPTLLPFRRRPVPGLDFCGEIVALGPSATATAATHKFEVGSVVCGAIPAGSVAVGVGTLAEYITVPVEILSLKPDDLSDAASSGLGIAGQTAALVMSEANVQPGQRVLINGASGGVGTFLCQIVTARGGVVTAVCSGSNAGLVRKLGAVEVCSLASGPRAAAPTVPMDVY